MATGSYYGQMRATDADRESVHAVLQAAYADGRLSWEDFDTRSSQLVVAKTYDQLACLTTDLRRPVPYQPPPDRVLRSSGHTSPLAFISLGFGIGQIFLPFLGGIVAVVCGHAAKSQIKQTGEQGAGMATAGLVLGYLGFAVQMLVLLLIVWIIARI
jgi:hypothetical protein